MRVGVIAFKHESNTFAASPTTWDDFAAHRLLIGGDVMSMADSHHEVGGFLCGGAEVGFDVVPILAAEAIPSGQVTAETYARLTDVLFRRLDAAGPLDGLLIAPHGAMAVEGTPDGDGDWMARLRDRFGSSRPIIATCDPHANVSLQMASAVDALIAYRTNPHLDQRERGIEAARLLARTLRGEVRPTQAASLPPLAINIERQSTAELPVADLCRFAEQLRAMPKVLSCSLILGFPYADVPKFGSGAIVVTNNDPPLAQALADEFGELLWSRRDDLTGRFLEPRDAVRKALAFADETGKPTCLLDMGDNIGGGSPGDGTVLLHIFREREVGPAFVYLNDPEGASAAARAGVGQRLQLTVGAKIDHLHGSPFTDDFIVQHIADGRFSEDKPRHGGNPNYDQGLTAIVVAADGIVLMLSSRRTPPFSLNQLTAFGVDPAQFRLIAAKGVVAPIAAYREVCSHFLRVNTPGVTTADMTRLPFQNRRRPLFPFEQDFTWTANLPAGC